MPNIATMLRSEITRLARKEVRAEVVKLHKSASGYRSEIAALKRRTLALERLVKQVRRGAPSVHSANAAKDEGGDTATGRFSAKSMRSQRRRLGLSAVEVGLLVGSSAQSVYNWEEGKTRPQARHLEAIFRLRRLGRRAVQARLEQLASSS